MDPRRWFAWIVLCCLLAGCAGTLPPHGDRAVSEARAAPAGTPIADIAGRIGLAEGTTAAWPMPQALFALDARLAAIERATTSLDTQTYLLADDPTGREVLRALRDAAARGVRVRMLLDDIGTAGLDQLLMGLASEPNAEVRLFNPFVTGREWRFGRLLALASDFDRLDHRMHNKLFIADGALAIVGGRNLADDYFLRSASGNYFDVELRLVGAIVPELSRSFDRYWNSAPAYDVRQIAAATESAGADAAALRFAFERRTAVDAPVARPTDGDLFGAPALSDEFATGRFRFLPVVIASTYADPPEKVDGSARGPAVVKTVADLFLQRLREARDEVVLFSPYFVPDAELMEHLRALRARGVSVRVITNSLAVSDEPMTTIALERHQRALLAIGVELYELSSERIRHDGHLQMLLGSSIGRLHAKMAFIDRRMVYVGSLNLDSRSANINTEIGLRVESAEIASMLFRAFRVEEAVGVYRVRLAPDGATLVWSIRDEAGREVTLDHEPDASWWQHLRVRLLSIFVPEGQL
jgi:putative cardiolipin synthase